MILALALDLDHVYVIRHTVCLLEEEYDCVERVARSHPLARLLR